MSELSTTQDTPNIWGNPALSRASLPIFASILLLSATLLFWVEPLFTKMVLPLLGGSPAVWNTAMLFFQTILLGGYTYAHLLNRYAPPRIQVMVQLCVLLVGLMFLPFAIGADISPPDVGTPAFWLIGVFTAIVGVPFFALSANAPLMQSWFSRIGHSHSQDPYFLYGASNLGSILALLAFPFILEPNLGITEQTGIWKTLYIILAAGIALSGIIMVTRHRTVNQADIQHATPRQSSLSASAPPTTKIRLHWLVLAFVPSSLLLGVTTHISTDIASAPLLWVIPLALYLLTFVNVFARRPLISHQLVIKYGSLFAVIFALFFQFTGLWLIGLHLAGFFILALLCHGELARHRPAAQHLTMFYLIMSLGGMLGGLFNALIAPSLFNSVYEYPIAIALACLLFPAGTAQPKLSRMDSYLLPAAILAAFLVPYWVFGLTFDTIKESWLIYGLIFGGFFAAGLIYESKDRPLRFGLSIAALLFGNMAMINQDTNSVTMRSFFGVYKVTTNSDGQIRTMAFGTTLHGAQFTDPAKRKTPLTYYTHEGPLGQLFEAIRPRALRVTSVGLGVGTVACYAVPGDDWTFYEIDPMVDAIAQNTDWFHFMEDCAPNAPVVYGDARLKLADAPAGATDLLILDAFSSDSIPTHMVTRQAFDLFTSRLAEGGIIVMNISNRYLELKPVVSAIAEANGLTGYSQLHKWEEEKGEKVPDYHTGSEWIVLSKTPEPLNDLIASGKWTALPPSTADDMWTDDYSDLIGVLR